MKKPVKNLSKAPEQPANVQKSVKPALFKPIKANEALDKKPKTSAVVEKLVHPIQPTVQLAIGQPPENILEDLEIQLADKSNRAVQLEIELETRQREVTSLRVLGQELQDQLRQCKKEQAYQLVIEEKLKSEIDNRVGELELFEEKLSKSQSIIQDKEILIDELNEVITTLRSELEKLNAQPIAYADMWIHQVKMEELEKELTEKNSLINQLEEKNADYAVELKECYLCLDELEKQIHDQEELIQQHEKVVQGLQDELVASESMIHAQRLENVENAERLDLLESALQTALTENEALIEDKGKTECSLNGIKIELEQCYQVINQLELQEEERDKYEMENLRLSASIQALQEEVLQMGIRETSLQNDLEMVGQEKIELQEALHDTLEENKRIFNALEFKQKEEQIMQVKKSDMEVQFIEAKRKGMEGIQREKEMLQAIEFEREMMKSKLMEMNIIQEERVMMENKQKEMENQDETLTKSLADKMIQTDIVYHADEANQTNTDVDELLVQSMEQIKSCKLYKFTNSVLEQSVIEGDLGV